MPPKLITSKQAATILGVSDSSIRRLSKSLAVGTKVGRDWFYTARDIKTLQARPRVGKYRRKPA